IQEKFSWNQVGLSAVSANLDTEALNIDPFIAGALDNAITQGIGRITGMQQSRFSWTSVAAAGVGARLGATLPQGGDLFSAVGRATAFDIADAATRSLIDGTDFGDNAIAALPDVLGQTIGDAIAGRIGRSSDFQVQSFALADIDASSIPELENI